MWFSKKPQHALKPGVLICFLFGVIFIAIILTISLNYSNPTHFQSRVFISILSLAGAGVAALIPGLIEIRCRKTLRVTGAIAIFALIYFNQPVSHPQSEKVVRPSASSLSVAADFLRYIDKGEVDQAYQYFITAGHQAQDIHLFRQVYQNIRMPLGELIERKVVNVGFSQSLADFPDGNYDVISWQSKFSGDARCYYEDLILKASEENQWGMTSWSLSDSVAC